MEKLYADGKCKAIGVSNYTIDHLTELLEYAKVKPAVNQVEFHPYLFQKDLLQFCQSKGILLQPYSPFAKGKGQLLSDSVVLKIAEKHKRTPSQVLLAWAISHNLPAIPKSSNPVHIEENASIFFPLTGDEVIALNGLDKNWRCTWDPHGIP